MFACHSLRVAVVSHNIIILHGETISALWGIYPMEVSFVGEHFLAVLEIKYLGCPRNTVRRALFVPAAEVYLALPRPQAS